MTFQERFADDLAQGCCCAGQTADSLPWADLERIGGQVQLFLARHNQPLRLEHLALIAAAAGAVSGPPVAPAAPAPDIRKGSKARRG